MLSSSLYKYISKYEFSIAQLRPKIKQLTYYIIRLYSLDRFVEALVVKIDTSKVGVKVGG